MPDEQLARGFLQTASKLVPARSRRPTQANLRRAVSTSYFAVFHALAKTCADSLVGTVKATRPNKAWVEVYRGLSHSVCKKACDNASSIGFPQELKDFANTFIQLQEARNKADYDPMIRVSKSEALMYISLARKSVNELRGVSTKDKRAFATWVLITSQGAKQARNRFQTGNIRNI